MSCCNKRLFLVVFILSLFISSIHAGTNLSNSMIILNNVSSDVNEFFINVSVFAFAKSSAYIPNAQQGQDMNELKEEGNYTDKGEIKLLFYNVSSNSWEKLPFCSSIQLNQQVVISGQTVYYGTCKAPVPQNFKNRGYEIGIYYIGYKDDSTVIFPSFSQIFVVFGTPVSPIDKFTMFFSSAFDLKKPICFISAFVFALIMTSLYMRGMSFVSLLDMITPRVPGVSFSPRYGSGSLDTGRTIGYMNKRTEAEMKKLLGAINTLSSAELSALAKMAGMSPGELLRLIAKIKARGEKGKGGINAAYAMTMLLHNLKNGKRVTENMVDAWLNEKSEEKVLNEFFSRIQDLSRVGISDPNGRAIWQKLVGAAYAMSVADLFAKSKAYKQRPGYIDVLDKGVLSYVTTKFTKGLLGEQTAKMWFYIPGAKIPKSSFGWQIPWRYARGLMFTIPALRRKRRRLIVEGKHKEWKTKMKQGPFKKIWYSGLIGFWGVDQEASYGAVDIEGRSKQSYIGLKKSLGLYTISAFILDLCKGSGKCGLPELYDKLNTAIVSQNYAEAAKLLKQFVESADRLGKVKITLDGKEMTLNEWLSRVVYDLYNESDVNGVLNRIAHDLSRMGIRNSAGIGSILSGANDLLRQIDNRSTYSDKLAEAMSSLEQYFTSVALSGVAGSEYFKDTFKEYASNPVVFALASKLFDMVRIAKDRAMAKEDVIAQMATSGLGDAAEYMVIDLVNSTFGFLDPESAAKLYERMIAESVKRTNVKEELANKADQIAKGASSLIKMVFEVMKDRHGVLLHSGTGSIDYESTLELLASRKKEDLKKYVFTNKDLLLNAILSMGFNYLPKEMVSKAIEDPTSVLRFKENEYIIFTRVPFFDYLRSFGSGRAEMSGGGHLASFVRDSFVGMYETSFTSLMGQSVNHSKFLSAAWPRMVEFVARVMAKDALELGKVSTSLAGGFANLEDAIKNELGIKDLKELKKKDYEKVLNIIRQHITSEDVVEELKNRKFKFYSWEIGKDPLIYAPDGFIPFYLPKEATLGNNVAPNYIYDPKALKPVEGMLNHFSNISNVAASALGGKITKDEFESKLKEKFLFSEIPLSERHYPAIPLYVVHGGIVRSAELSKVSGGDAELYVSQVYQAAVSTGDSNLVNAATKLVEFLRDKDKVSLKEVAEAFKTISKRARDGDVPLDTNFVLQTAVSLSKHGVSVLGMIDGVYIGTPSYKERLRIARENAKNWFSMLGSAIPSIASHTITQAIGGMSHFVYSQTIWREMSDLNTNVRWYRLGGFAAREAERHILGTAQTKEERKTLLRAMGIEKEEELYGERIMNFIGWQIKREPYLMGMSVSPTSVDAMIRSGERFMGPMIGEAGWYKAQPDIFNVLAIVPHGPAEGSIFTKTVRKLMKPIIQFNFELVKPFALYQRRFFINLEMPHYLDRRMEIDESIQKAIIEKYTEDMRKAGMSEKEIEGRTKEIKESIMRGTHPLYTLHPISTGSEAYVTPQKADYTRAFHHGFHDLLNTSKNLALTAGALTVGAIYGPFAMAAAAGGAFVANAIWRRFRKTSTLLSAHPGHMTGMVNEEVIAGVRMGAHNFNYYSRQIGNVGLDKAIGHVYHDRSTGKMTFESWALSGSRYEGELTSEPIHPSLYKYRFATGLGARLAKEQEHVSLYSVWTNPFFGLLHPAAAVPHIGRYVRGTAIGLASMVESSIESIRERKREAGVKGLVNSGVKAAGKGAVPLLGGIVGGALFQLPGLVAGLSAAGGYKAVKRVYRVKCPRCGSWKKKGERCPVCGFMTSSDMF